MTRQIRRFEIAPATRSALWLSFAVYGPSGAGKTYSALRLATGMASVSSGEVFGIDTENRRMSHYADAFKFQAINLEPPYDSDSYVDAINACVDAGAKVIIIDSGTHEHAHMLQWHTAEAYRIAKGDESRLDACKMAAWIQPQAARDRLILAFARVQAHMIWCFRADTKVDLKNPRKPENLGWMPEGARKLIYEMTAAALLMPGANGVPTWNPTGEGERQMVKSPKQFREMFSRFDGKPFCEEMGAEMAQWAKGDTALPLTPPIDHMPRLLNAIRVATTHAEIDAVGAEMVTFAKSQQLTKSQQDKIKAAGQAKRATLAEGA